MTRGWRRTWAFTLCSAISPGWAVFPALALAQTPQDEWHFTAYVYSYWATLSGSATFPTGTSANITVDPNQLLHSLNFAIMGAFEVQRGPWGLFTDIIYVDASGSKTATRDLSVGGVTIPSGVTANVGLDVKSTVWTLGGSYRFAATPEATFDLLAGARDLILKQHLTWQFSADVGPLAGPARQGSSDSNPNNWDGIVGIKGRVMFGDQHTWFVPYYIDVGTGESKLTWQALGGLGYTFHWGEVIGVWRYLDYQFSKNSASLSMNGPAIGIAFHW
jgi:hypothetical protein